MRSIEALVREYPELTGTEILEIQRKDKEADEFEYQERNKKRIELVEDLTKNGAYYRGRFGSDQYFYYNFFNVVLEDDVIYCDCENLTLFSGEGIQSVTDWYQVEIRTETYKKLENYGINVYERVTKKEWDEVTEYFTSSPKKFW